MSYIDEALGEGERLVYRARISLWSLAAPLAWLAILLTGSMLFFSIRGMENLGWFLLVVAMGAGLRAAALYYGTELGITSQRVIAKTGIIRRDTVEIALSRIESIQIAQSIAGRLFNYGAIRIAGTGTSHPMIRGVAAPLAFRKAFGDITAGKS